MDIHRCRFVPYPPHPINALAFSHTSNAQQTTPPDLRLALGRENGDIEIWNPNSSWVQERILRGGTDRTIEQLSWTQDLLIDEDDTEKPVQNGPLRLFSSGGSPLITEWDLNAGTQKRHVEGNSGDIWCLAVQPQWSKKEDVNKIAGAPSQLLAAGCSTGTIVLFSTTDGELQFQRVLAPAQKRKAKVISITWRDRSTVVAGYENGTIRIIDVPSRSVVRTMSLGRGQEGGNAVVWTVKCLPDGTILSGDSSGELKVWDRRLLSLVQKLKAHEVDVLDIATSSDGDMIFTAGVDRRTVAYKRVASQGGNKKDMWQQVMHRRFHQHDVKALAAFESKGMSVMVSGGMDTTPIVIPLRNWDKEYHRSLTHLPQKPQLSCSASARLMLTWWGKDLFIWHIPKRLSEPELYETSIGDGIDHKLLCRLQLKGDEHITSAQLAENGTMLVVSTSAEVKLFQLRKRVESGSTEVRTRPVDLPAGIRAFGASHVGFSSNSKWLYSVRHSNVVALVKVLPGETAKERPIIHEKVIKLSRKARKDRQMDSFKLGRYSQTINTVAMSSDSRILATGDLSGAIDVWILEGHEDTQASIDENDDDGSSDSDSDSDSEDESDISVVHGQKWARNPAGSDLPQLKSAILALSFKPQPTHVAVDAGLGLHATRHNPHPVSHESPSPDTKLVAITASHQLVEFDVLSAKLSDWSRRNPSSCLPESFTKIADRVMGLFWDCNNQQTEPARERLWLYGPAWLFMLDMTRDLLDPNTADTVGDRLGKYEVENPTLSPLSAKRKLSKLNLADRNARKKMRKGTGAGGQTKHGESFSTKIFERGSDDEDSQDDDEDAQKDGVVIKTGLISPISDDYKDDDQVDDNEDEDGDVEMGGTLTSLRRQHQQDQSNTISRMDSKKKQQQGRYESKEDEKGIISTSSPSTLAHWTTFRYRSIFGISALYPPSSASASSISSTETRKVITHNNEDGDENKPNHNKNLEIVIVERPLYDVDLPPRFDGGQDWST